MAVFELWGPECEELKFRLAVEAEKHVRQITLPLNCLLENKPPDNVAKFFSHKAKLYLKGARSAMHRLPQPPTLEVPSNVAGFRLILAP